MKKAKPRTGSELRRRLLADIDEPSVEQLIQIDSAAAAFDLALRAEREIGRHGVLINGPRGPRTNPAVAVAQTARQKLLRALDRL